MISPPSDAERIARATLTWLGASAGGPLATLVGEHGASAVLGLIRSGSLPADSQPWPGTAVSIVARWQAKLADVPAPARIAGMLDGRIRLACPGDPEWPPQMDSLGSRQPYALWLRGTADLRFTCHHSSTSFSQSNDSRTRAVLCISRSDCFTIRFRALTTQRITRSSLTARCHSPYQSSKEGRSRFWL